MLQNLSIKARLIATMGLMGVMLVAVGAMGIVGLQDTNESLKEVYTDQLASSIAINNSQVRLLQARTALDRAVLRPNAANVQDIVKRAENFHAESEAEWKTYLALPRSDDEKKLADEVAAKRAIYLRDGASVLIAAIRAGQPEEAERLLFDTIQPLFFPLNQSADALADYQLKTAAATYEASQSTFAAYRTAAILGIWIGLTLVAVSAFLLVRAITRPLREMLGHFDAIAAGDLTSRIEVKSGDEMGMLMRGLQKM